MTQRTAIDQGRIAPEVEQPVALAVEIDPGLHPRDMTLGIGQR